MTTPSLWRAELRREFHAEGEHRLCEPADCPIALGQHPGVWKLQVGEVGVLIDTGSEATVTLTLTPGGAPLQLDDAHTSALLRLLHDARLVSWARRRN